MDAISTKIANGRKVEKDVITMGRYRCLVVLDETMFHRCGYIIVPPEHPFADGKHDNDVHVHGGVTYSEPSGDGGWVYGFDCAHINDIPDVEAAKRTLSGEKLEGFMRYFDTVSKPLFDEPVHMWDKFDVWRECMIVAADMELYCIIQKEAERKLKEMLDNEG